MTSPTARLVRRAGLLLMLAAALAGFFLLISFLVAQISSGPSDLLAARPSEEKGIPMPNGAGLFTFAVAAIALILGIVALAAPRHWALRGGIPRPRRSLVVGALAAAVLVGAGLYLAFSGVLSQDIAYGEHQAQRKWVEPAGLLVLAGFFLSVAIVGIVNPRFLLAPLAVWLAVAIGFGFFDSPALAGLNLFERPSKLEEPTAYAAEVEKYRRREDPSTPMAAAVPWDVSLPLESGGVVLSRGDSEFVLVPGTSTGWNQSSVSNPLFEVTGAAHTSFLRSATGDVYENGEWTQLDPVEVTTNPGAAIPESVLGLIGDRLNEQIVPLQPHRLRRELLSRPLTPPEAMHVDQIPWPRPGNSIRLSPVCCLRRPFCWRSTRRESTSLQRHLPLFRAGRGVQVGLVGGRVLRKPAKPSRSRGRCHLPSVARGASLARPAIGLGPRNNP